MSDAADLDWEFADRDDARSYLAEIGRLWTGWLITLFFLMTMRGLALLAVAVVGLIVMYTLAKPIQQRVYDRYPEDEPLSRGGTKRDRALRGLVYGTEPLRTALALAGSSPRWVLARHVVVAATVAGFVWVLIDVF
jgi:hypothetical protein